MADTKKFEVRLESQTDEQFRIVNLRAKDAAEARARCEEKEADYCAYQLEPAELETIELAHVFSDGSVVGDDGRLIAAGKVLGPDSASRAKLHAHHQSKPYRITDIKEL